MSLEEKSPILIFLFFHKAVRNELDALNRLAMAFATGKLVDIPSLRERYRFLRSVYTQYSSAEDEVIFPALDKRVKNVALAYSLQHKGETILFDHLLQLLCSFNENDESFPRELAFCTEALRGSISQHMTKEEEQVFQLLVEKFSFEEQAYLVWQFICGIPVSVLAEFLPWVAFSISRNEYEEMQKFLSKIVPNDNLFQQVILSWMSKRKCSDGIDTNVHAECRIDSISSTLGQQSDEDQSGCVSFKIGKRECSEPSKNINDAGVAHPIDEIKLWHNAITKELNDLADEARQLQHGGDFPELSAFDDRLQFITEVCIFHSMAEDKIIIPALKRECTFAQKPAKEGNKFNDFRCLIQSMENAGEFSTSDANFYEKLGVHADKVIQSTQDYFYNKETQVLPLVRKHFSFKRQREILYEIMCIMPLRLTEHILPWFVKSLTDDEAKNFIRNLQSAAPPTDSALVTLLSAWACKDEDERVVKQNITLSCINSNASKSSGIVKGHNSSQNKRSYCVPVLGAKSNCLEFRPLSAAKSWWSSSLITSALSPNSSLLIGETNNWSSNISGVERPIDTIFKFHKAIRKDIEYLDAEAGKLSDCNQTFLHQFIGRFRLLWSLYRAHSNAEDDVVFPALESKEGLLNVSHSYTLDHKQEEKLFEDISCALSELTLLHERLRRASMMEEPTKSTNELSCNSIKIYNELATKLQGMCKSIKITLDQHLFREELELWPLFGMHFSIEDQEKIVGRIIGTTGAEVLQSMLPWLTSALTQDEQIKLMDTWKAATKNTMFNEWLKECWKEPFESSSKIETSKPHLSHKYDDNQESLDQSDHMFKPGWKDIFRINQNELEMEIRKVYRDSTLDPRRQAYLVQNLMTSQWIAAQQKLPGATDVDASNGKEALGCSPSFRDDEKRVLGCEHYKRNCKLRAACCGKLFTCRFCHDEVSDHSMDRNATLEMMCMRCLEIQGIGPICKTPTCNGLSMGKYYCNICKFFDDARTVYHCPFCNLCRVGKGLGIDYFHCMTCNCCLGMKLLNHKCLEKILETNCPICCDFLFTSTPTVRALPCGHYMHSACFQAYSCSHYICPICSKSLGDMTVYFGMLDTLLDAEGLPEEYRDCCQDILCNDCDRKGTSRFHWLYHKCGSCGSYNTRVIKSETPTQDCSTSN